MVTVRKGQFATEKLQVGKQFVEPSPDKSSARTKSGRRLPRYFEQYAERLWDGKFRIPLDGVTTGSNFEGGGF